VAAEQLLVFMHLIATIESFTNPQVFQASAEYIKREPGTGFFGYTFIPAMQF